LRLFSLSTLLIVGSACAHQARAVHAAGPEIVRLGDTFIQLSYGPDDAEAAQRVKAALHRAVSSAGRWGHLPTPTLITIHPTHQALEAASRMEGYPWLRAWARHASIDVQSPRTWSPSGGSDEQLAQLLAHELTHCVMYESAAPDGSWPTRAIPLWFREGMASVTAGQKHLRVRPEDIARFYAESLARAGPSAEGAGGGDPLTEPGPLYQSRSNLVYATAHWAFELLLERHGEQRIRQLLAIMNEGSPFAEAFQEALGAPVQDFERDFRHHVASRSPRG
jgi:hypothetical protein